MLNLLFSVNSLRFSLYLHYNLIRPFIKFRRSVFSRSHSLKLKRTLFTFFFYLLESCLYFLGYLSSLDFLSYWFYFMSNLPELSSYLYCVSWLRYLNSCPVLTSVRLVDSFLSNLCCCYLGFPGHPVLTLHCNHSSLKYSSTLSSNPTFTNFFITNCRRG